MSLMQQSINSKSKILLLEKLLDKSGSFSVSELGRLSGIPKATVSGIVNDWEKAGLVLVEYQGRNKLAKINQKFYLLPELKKIFRKTSDFQQPLLSMLESSKLLKNPKIKAVIVFGSRIRKDFSHHSDLDVLIGLEQKNSELEEKIVEKFVSATASTGIRFSPAILDKKEIKSRLKEKDLFFQNILSEGKILKGRTWIEHLQTAL
ncbi:MAG: nucleotidyltransferase domain-containing protein [archaeon]